ncbi:hypothetical protein BCR43DRAFT_254781 [Syncephalastrum racemosum]|uniref:Uncharacterized protein n=1 Tax=Syncephalastrum racemosum TaxID=13706 RepID=A0A1X2HFY7_SYNRA|nr:hypothetical protein BCR43DRAFT_254781 [Syncephalastrum racemosum]
MILGCPEGYVTRLTKLPTYEFPVCEQLFVKQIARLVTMVWQTKAILKDSLKCIQLDEGDEGTPCSLPGSLPSPKPKKRKK